MVLTDEQVKTFLDYLLEVATSEVGQLQQLEITRATVETAEPIARLARARLLVARDLLEGVRANGSARSGNAVPL